MEATAMTTHSKETGKAAIPPGERVKLLAGVPAFALVPTPVLEELGACLKERSFAEKSAVIIEGEVCDRVYLIAQGRVELSTVGASGSVPLATLTVGETFGETLNRQTIPRTADYHPTVKALTPLLTLTLAQSDLEKILAAYPLARGAMIYSAQKLTAKFLKEASPFLSLDLDRLMALASKLEPVAVSAGAMIIEQGERGETCYLLRSGHVEVVVKKEDGSERRLATLGPGTLFGETALLTDAPRNATVRALEACALLALRRDDLMEAMKADQRTIAQMMELMSLRDRPRQTKGIIAHQHSTPEGETITILKNPRQGSYYRLSPQGWFLWQLLDGQHTVRDLTLDYLGQFKALAPQAVAEVLCGLGAAGFLERKSLSGDVTEAASHLTPWQRALVMARRILEWQVSVRNIDAPITWLYRAGIRWIYTRAGQIILGLLSLAGLFAFILIGSKAGLALHHEGGSALLLFLIPGYLFSILLHEAGHAFTVKAFGYEVPRAGVGWYWFGPVAFVDTSDIWLAGRWPRIAVSLAGPYTNLALGSLAALAAWLSSSPSVIAALWAFTLVSYVMVLVNFNPLLEYDGYYILMDWLERPNLRPRALAWLGSELPQAWRTREELRKHSLELIYGLGSLLYIVLMCVLTLVSYRLFVQHWMAQLLPITIAEALAWVMAAAVLVLSAVSVVGELRGARPR